MRSIRYGPPLAARKYIRHLFHWSNLTPAGATFDQITIDASYVTELPTSRLLLLSGSPIRHFLDYFICQRYYNQKYCSNISFLSVTYLVNIESQRQECEIWALTLQQLDYHRHRNINADQGGYKIVLLKYDLFSQISLGTANA